MTVAEGAVANYDVVEHLAEGGEYVVYIVDLWKGSRHDPATRIDRYIGCFRGADLEKDDGEAFDPDWSRVDLSRAYRMEQSIKPAPLHWHMLEVAKEADRSAHDFQSQQEGLLDKEGYRYGSSRLRAGLYQQFMDAIDVLAVDPENETAWVAVQAYRDYNARLHEK